MSARGTKTDHDMITEIHTTLLGRGGVVERVEDVEKVSTENRRRLNYLAGATTAVVVIMTVLGGLFTLG